MIDKQISTIQTGTLPKRFEQMFDETPASAVSPETDTPKSVHTNKDPVTLTVYKQSGSVMKLNPAVMGSKFDKII